MVFYAFKNVAVYLSLQLILQLTTSYTYGILINNRTLFINSNNNDHYRSLKTIKVSLSNNDSGPNKYIENFLKSSLSKNLFKNQTSDFTANSAELNKL